MWVELPEAVDVAELEKAAAEREVLFVKGTDFLLEGGQNTLRLAYSGVTPGADRRGHHEAGRGRSVPWRRGITTATTPRSTACCTARGRSRCVIHGGFWKAEYDLELMDALCADLAGRGWAAWNIEYRRLGNGGGVPATLDDVGAAIDHLADARRRPLAGRRRSATPRAAISRRGRRRASNPRVAVTHVVSQAGVLDLQRARELRLSDGVVDRFLGGAADATSPRRSSASRSASPRCSPTAALDDIVPLEISRALRRGLRRDAARRARRGPLRPPRPREPAVEGGARHGSDPRATRSSSTRTTRSRASASASSSPTSTGSTSTATRSAACPRARASGCTA